MSVQDKVERVLREFYVLYSRSEPYDKNAERVIVNKKEALALLEQLKSCMNEMMEEYEMTSNSRERGEREARRRRDDIIWDANHKAEDIYAASVLYSNEALGHIQTIIQNATDEMEKMFHTAKKEMMKQQQTVRDNQLELKSSLEDLKTCSGTGCAGDKGSTGTGYQSKSRCGILPLETEEKSRWLKNVPIRYGKKLSISDGHNHLGNTYPIIFIFEFPPKTSSKYLKK